MLSQSQLDLLPLIKQYKSDYYLVGGTAIALLLGHRESIDFDLFTFKDKNQSRTKTLLQSKVSDKIVSILENKEQAHFIINGVKQFYRK
ncbi:MAG: nucleotidyl transferase AbiEii/AbiGii toxin family protein [Vicingaceae bacterium]|nr:nucleotidyl transferase AbiEii/AbiGii toxin family protein [Vicingaceae bacterium]